MNPAHTDLGERNPMTPGTQVLTDLDALCGPPAKVRLGGKEWKVPGRPPLDWLFTFQVIEQRLQTDGVDEFEVIAQVRDHLVELLTIHQPGREDEIRAALGKLDGLAVLLAARAMYMAGGPPQEGDAVPPRKPARRAGTRNGTKASRSRSRSST